MKRPAHVEHKNALCALVFCKAGKKLDIIGLAAGNLRLPAWKFFLPAWPGKTIKYTVLAYVGYWGWEAFIGDANLRTTLIVTIIAALSVAVLLVLALVFEHFDWKKKQ